MDSFLSGIFSQPLYWIGFVIAFLAAFSFLIFLRGFLSGLPHLFTLAGNDEFLPDHRRRVLWGFFLLLYLFILWEIIRWIFSWFGVY